MSQTTDKPGDTRSLIPEPTSQTAQEYIKSQLDLEEEAKEALPYGNVTGETPRSGNKYNHNFGGHFCGCGDTYDPNKEKGTMFQCLGLGTVESGGCGEDWWHPECLLGLPREEKQAKPEQVLTKNEAGDELAAIEEEGQDAPVPEQADAQDDIEPPLPAGFPEEDSFDHFICYKCVESNPWIKRYAGTAGFLPAVFFPQQSNGSTGHSEVDSGPVVAGAKRKAEDDEEQVDGIKRAKVEDDEIAHVPTTSAKEPSQPKHHQVPIAPNKQMSLFLKEDFRDHFCKCPECFPNLKAHPQLLEEEETYEPPVSEGSEDGANGGGSVGSRSLLERGEAALSTMDRMRAIEGVMAYNHLRDKVKTFLQPFAESGQAVGAEDVKAYFAKLRGDEEAMRSAATGAGGADGNDDSRREQSGY
ncbi:hypothetical protein MBLNU457_7517t2 [Dothideomycetes sp. NU457]